MLIDAKLRSGKNIKKQSFMTQRLAMNGRRRWRYFYSLFLFFMKET